MVVTLTKLSNDRYTDEQVPIKSGTTRSISVDTPPIPEVDRPFLFGTLLTSVVTEMLVIEEGYIKFKTHNSTYVLKYQ